MVMMKVSIVFALSLWASFATAHEFAHLGRLIPPVVASDLSFPILRMATNATDATSTTGTGFFTQLLDHNNPSKGTFQQQFWWNSQYWDGPGSPVSF